MTTEEQKAKDAQAAEVAKLVKEGIAEGLKDAVADAVAEVKAQTNTSNVNDFTKRTYGLVSKKKAELIEVEKGYSGFVVLEFTKNHGTKVKGDEETYHVSTATALVNKLKVAKVKSQVKKYVPKKEKKN